MNVHCKISVWLPRLFTALMLKTANDEKKFYFGVSETLFKERFRNHKKELNYVKYRNSTELSKYIWKLRDLNISPKI